ncbi:TPA: phenylalanine--tRNA ligase subunit beta [Patescibacteria group bacterium]|nr:phenylalanine--tRNA ligase subunit beta [Patescibacteria group bacterium]
MKFSYQLLKSWLNFKLSPQELSDLIYLHITEVESVETHGKWANFVVGEILAIKPHPNADKLSLTQVDVGGRVLGIVCGAHNIAVGQHVPVALVGAKLPDGTIIREAVIRGEPSDGMLCSSAELGLTGDASGIRLLDTKRQPGTSLSELLGDDGDSILDLKILANRPDYISYRSLAREIAEVLRQDWQPPAIAGVRGASATEAELRVEVKDPVACPRYMARIIQNIQVGPSPEWLQQTLTAVGLRPINNIVDAANYVMLETGQPIHAFDLNKVKDRSIIVRSAKVGETLACLDGVTRPLDVQTLVIADSSGPLAIAGVIGGETSGVGESTTAVAVEVANFDFVSIRNTSRRLGLRTDASNRFERGLDVFLPELALRRVIKLIQQLCPDSQVGKDTIDVHQKLPPASRLLEVSAEAINRLLGIIIPTGEMADILNRLDLSTTVNGDRLSIAVPHDRSDIDGMADIAEEILRIYGTDQVPLVMPALPLALPTQPDLRRVLTRVRETLARLGLFEVYLHPFDVGGESAVELDNPLSSVATHLKTDLTEGLRQLEAGRSDFRIFEVGTVFAKAKTVFPEERQQLVLRISEPDAYRVARGIADTLLGELGLTGTDWREVAGVDGLRLVRGQEMVGELRRWGSEATFALDLSAIAPQVRWTREYRPLPKYPVVKMDMAFFIPDRVRIADLIKDIWAADPLVDAVELFDIFRSPDRGRSAAFHVQLRSNVRTLTKEDRDKVNEVIKNMLLERHKARLRDE